MNELNIGIGVPSLVVTAQLYLDGVASGAPIATADLGAGLYSGNMAGAAGTYTVAFLSGGVLYGSGQIVWNGTAEDLSAAQITSITASVVPAIVTNGPIATSGGIVSSDIKKVDGTTVAGAGVPGNLWRPQ